MTFTGARLGRWGKAKWGKISVIGLKRKWTGPYSFYTGRYRMVSMCSTERWSLGSKTTTKGSVISALLGDCSEGSAEEDHPDVSKVRASKIDAQRQQTGSLRVKMDLGSHRPRTELPVITCF